MNRPQPARRVWIPKPGSTEKRPLGIPAVRDRIVDHWVDATRKTYRDGRKRVYYFSLEFLIGRLLFDALGNLGLTATAREALRTVSESMCSPGTTMRSLTPRFIASSKARSERSSGTKYDADRSIECA